MPHPTTTPDPTHPANRLARAIDALATPACVGVDPVPDRLPEGVTLDAPGIESFSLGVLDAVAGVVPAVKPQSACFERFGSAGFAALERVVARAKDLALEVVLDAKRGDIGSTSAHYAACAAGMGADWITVNPYLGRSGIEPFLDAGLGVFALVRTSNPDSDEVQAPELTTGGTVAQRVAGMVRSLGEARRADSGLSAIGAVVGATKASAAGAALRAAMPDQFFLVPGVGAQGATPADVTPLARPNAESPGRAGLLVNASRSVIFAPPAPGQGWQDAVRAAAQEFARALTAALAE